MRSIESTGGRIPPELLIPVADPEKTPSAQDLELLEASPDLVQALLLLEPMSVTHSNVIDHQLLAPNGEAGDLQISISSGCQGEGGTRYMADDSCDSDTGSESNLESSCISTDSITRNANFEAVN